MKLKAILLVVFVFMIGACSSPEGKLADYFDSAASIMEDNDDPIAGLEELTDFYVDNLPGLLKATSGVLVNYDKCSNKEERTEYLSDLLGTMQEPMVNLAKAADPFFKKLKKADPKKLQAFQEKFAKDWAFMGKMQDHKLLKDIAKVMDEIEG